MSYLRDKLPAAETRTFSPDLRGLRDWLETQDGATEYDWMNSHTCVAGQFCKAIGLDAYYSVGTHAAIFGEKWPPEGGGDHPIYHRVTWTKPRTFGAALARTEAEIARQTGASQ